MKVSKTTDYINKIICKNLHTFWIDDTFNRWMEQYLASSFATKDGYTHYKGNVYKCHLWFGRIHAVDKNSTLIASVSLRNFKKFCRRN